MYDFISIGSVLKDIILITDRGKIFKTPKDKLAPEWLGFELGEKIRIEEIYQNIGGVATDVSVGLSKIGFSALPVSTIGDDENGHWLIKEIRKEKIGTNGIILKKNRLTPFSILLVDKKSGERVIFTQKSSGDLDLASLPKFKAKYLYVSSLKGKMKEQTRHILNYVHKNKPHLIVAPSTSQIRDDFPDLKKLLKAAKILILNRNEAVEIASNAECKSTGIKDLIKLLHDFGPETICITDGTKGAHCSDSRNIFFSPILKVKTVDVTGAGDAFACGFLGFYLAGRPIKESLKAGIVNSANVVQYVGTTKGLLTKKVLISKIRSL